MNATPVHVYREDIVWLSSNDNLMTKLLVNQSSIDQYFLVCPPEPFHQHPFLLSYSEFDLGDNAVVSWVNSYQSLIWIIYAM